MFRACSTHPDVQPGDVHAVIIVELHVDPLVGVLFQAIVVSVRDPPVAMSRLSRCAIVHRKVVSWLCTVSSPAAAIKMLVESDIIVCRFDSSQIFLQDMFRLRSTCLVHGSSNICRARRIDTDRDVCIHADGKKAKDA